MSLEQVEVLIRLLNRIQEKYPEAKFIRLRPHPEDAASVWLDIAAPEDEERDWALREYAAHLTTDILIEHDLMISVHPLQQAV